MDLLGSLACLHNTHHVSATQVRSLPSRLPSSRSHPVLVKGALQLDRAAIALDARPQLRAAIMAYFVLLHALALLF